MSFDNFFFQWKIRERLSAFLQCFGKSERRITRRPKKERNIFMGIETQRIRVDKVTGILILFGFPSCVSNFLNAFGSVSCNSCTTGHQFWMGGGGVLRGRL